MVKVRKPNRHEVRPFHTDQGLPSLVALRSELIDMTAVLKGDKEPPIRMGVMTLMELADGYFARASEITMTIQRLEADNIVKKGSPLNRFRTGELRTFAEMARKSFELGSRRLTHAQLKHEQAFRGREAV